MASAHAKFTGELGVCIATSGPGASHLLTGLYDAGWTTCRCWRSPASRRAPRSAATISRSSIFVRMFKDVAGAFVQQASAPAQVRHLVDRAMRIAHGRTHGDGADPPERPAGDGRTKTRRASTARCIPASASASRRSFPYDDDLRRAAEVLNAGKKVAILVGAGALHATDEVIAVADKLGAGVAKALLGKAVLPDDLPWVTGSIGLLGTKPS